MATTHNKTLATATRIAGATALAVLLAATPAFALTAGEVLDKMTEEQRGGYIAGAVDMALYLAATQEKNNAKAECIREWFFSKEPKGPRQVIMTFHANREVNAMALIKVLINRACPAGE